MEIFGYIAIAFLVYCFVGYPLLLAVVAQFFVRSPKRGKAGQSKELPVVTLIIAAYNEATVIQEKIDNTLALEYPKDKLEIIIFSDASTDATDEIIRSNEHKGVTLLRIEGRQGKTACQNEAVKHAQGEIVVFSDANSMYDAFAIQRIVESFADESVGCVCGELRYTNKDGISKEGLYWKYERYLKRCESAIDSCLGANGAIYAVRSNVYVPLPVDVPSDFVEPFMIYRQGYRVVYQPDAFCVEESNTNTKELRRKRRIIARALQGMRCVYDFLNPFRYGWYSFSFWSHKILRWVSPLFMIGLFVSSAFLIAEPFFFVLFIAQCLFYIAALVGFFVQQSNVFAIPYYIGVIQLASFLALIDYLCGKKKIVWNARSN